MKSFPISSRLTPFTNQWLTLHVDSLILPKGSSQKYTYIVRHHSGVVIIPYFTATDSLLLSSQYRHPIGKTIWQLPGGGQELNQTARATAIKELFEETGYSPSRLINLGKIYPDAGIMGNTGQIFLALNPKYVKKPPITDSFETVKSKIFTRQQVKNMIQKGRIRDGWTLSAYLLLLIYLDGQR